MLWELFWYIGVKNPQKQKPDLKARQLKHFWACFITMLIYSRNHFIWQRPIVNVYKSKKAQICSGTISSLGLSSSSCIMILRTSKPWTQWLFVLSYCGKNQMENHFPSVSVADGWLQRKTDRTSRTALLTVSIRTTNVWPFHIFKHCFVCIAKVQRGRLCQTDYRRVSEAWHSLTLSASDATGVWSRLSWGAVWHQAWHRQWSKAHQWCDCTSRDLKDTCLANLLKVKTMSAMLLYQNIVLFSFHCCVISVLNTDRSET